METTMVSTSAIGTASQIPGSPINMGKTTIDEVSSKKVRKNEISADITPFDSEVKSDEAKIFIPVKIKEIENNKNPFLAMS